LFDSDMANRSSTMGGRGDGPVLRIEIYVGGLSDMSRNGPPSPPPGPPPSPSRKVLGLSGRELE